MPHCIIEYSNDLIELVTPRELIGAVYNANEESRMFDNGDIKVRAMSFAHHKTVNDTSGFIHVTLKILAGRSLHRKEKLSALVLKNLDELPLFNVHISVAVQEIEVASYSKLIK